MTLKTTPRQREILAAIAEHAETFGCVPTLRELGERVGIGSTNGVSDHLRALKRKGLISFDDERNGSRSMTLTELGFAEALRLIPTPLLEAMEVGRQSEIEAIHHELVRRGGGL